VDDEGRHRIFLTTDDPADVAWYVYDGPGDDANLLEVFAPREPLYADRPKVWITPIPRSQP
jgi:hypothetical protein